MNSEFLKSSFETCMCLGIAHCPVGGAEHAAGIESTPPSRASPTKTVCISSPAQQHPPEIPTAQMCTHKYTHMRFISAIHINAAHQTTVKTNNTESVDGAERTTGMILKTGHESVKSLGSVDHMFRALI